MYRLLYDPGSEAAHDALPSAASEALTLALEAACHDPLGRTLPRGEADEWNRTVLADGAVALIFISHTHKSVAVLDIIPMS
ncbi:hypothetical protein EYS09_22230 [Streptomyces kasugaensis]|uniref:Type II toxin-antitoxin system RelE/ParE family toxin n=1 Tax=Streptomyces kasugaensis TaxID=1946 RepID=A0A4Q9HRE4_STRKA|nr:hypothetical protein [Streptomyces kasugaensis]TBO57532.1 hypothetical protein EYS09_22230 [Streptomyces kasugaensis]